jgi:hypothetical protein
VVDQDPSDNLPTTYLVITGNGTFPQATIQDTANNRSILTANNIAFTTIGNPSDEKLTAQILGPAVGCLPGSNGAWAVPDLADAGHLLPSLPTNELQSAKFGPTPIALVPANDPMAQDNGVNNLAKVDLYRAGVDQPTSASSDNADPVAYCRNYRLLAPARIFLDKPYTIVAPTPLPMVGNSLFTVLAARYAASYAILGCDALLHQPVNIIITVDGNGVAINARTLGR